MMKKNEIEKAANAYINSEEFPVIGYPHLAKQDFIKGVEWANKTIIDKAEKWLCKYFVEDNYGMSPSGFGVFMHMFKQGLEE